MPAEFTTSSGSASTVRPGGLIQIVLLDGVVVRMDAHVDGRALRRDLGALEVAMISLASGSAVYLACGVTDMREGMVGLSMLVQQNTWPRTRSMVPYMPSSRTSCTASIKLILGMTVSGSAC